MALKTVKAGRYVQLPDGKVGVVVHIGGQASSAFVDPSGSPDSYENKVKTGFALVHELDENGETVMVKHPTLMRFISKEIILPVGELVPTDQHPARVGK